MTEENLNESLEACKEACPVGVNPISWYLMCAYSYYVEDESMTDDFTFDRLCKLLLEHFDGLPDHPHKHLLTKDNLQAGTYLGEYPEMLKGAVSHYKWFVLEWRHKSKEKPKKKSEKKGVSKMEE